jgi:hypothetical protein
MHSAPDITPQIAGNSGAVPGEFTVFCEAERFRGGGGGGGGGDPGGEI